MALLLWRLATTGRFKDKYDDRFLRTIYIILGPFCLKDIIIFGLAEDKFPQAILT